MNSSNDRLEIERAKARRAYEEWPELNDILPLEKVRQVRVQLMDENAMRNERTVIPQREGPPVFQDIYLSTGGVTMFKVGVGKISGVVRILPFPKITLRDMFNFFRKQPRPDLSIFDGIDALEKNWRTHIMRIIVVRGESLMVYKHPKKGTIGMLFEKMRDDEMSRQSEELREFISSVKE